MKFSDKDLLLYAVTDRTWLGNLSLEEVVEISLSGGVSMLQLREKNLDKNHFLCEARKIKSLCHKYSVPFIVNDDVEIAVRSAADGVHVGQCDMEANEVRKKIGRDMILGVSAQTVEQAVRAENAGADYIGVGAVFPTSSKSDADIVSAETLKEICRAVSIPVVAIGGINLGNMHLLEDSGIKGIAVISAIYAQKDIKDASRKLREESQRRFLK